MWTCSSSDVSATVHKIISILLFLTGNYKGYNTDPRLAPLILLLLIAITAPVLMISGTVLISAFSSSNYVGYL